MSLLRSDYYYRSTFKITMEEAIAHRLRWIYLPLFAVILAAWVIRVTAFVEHPRLESLLSARFPACS